jgi:hypothetical protein
MQSSVIDGGAGASMRGILPDHWTARRARGSGRGGPPHRRLRPIMRHGQARALAVTLGA